MPEEEKGVGEPYTIKTDIAEVTYQYNEGVKPITENVMKYFAGVESDTILYFTDNCPKQWLPEVGGYVMIGCNTEFPIGYAGRVLQRSDTNGMVRLVTTFANSNDIFKDIEYVVDTPMETLDIPEDYDPEDYVFGDSIDDSFASQRRISRASLDDKTYIDYSLVKEEVPELYEWQMKKHFPEKLRRSRAGGGTGTGDEDENVSDNDTTSTLTFKLNINRHGVSYDVKKEGNHEIPLQASVSTAIVDALTKYLDETKKAKEKAEKEKHYDFDGSPYLEVVLKRTNSTHYHSEHSKKKDFQETWNKETVTTNFSITAGFEVGGKVYGAFPMDDGSRISHTMESAVKELAKQNKGKESERHALFGFEKIMVVVPSIALVVKGRIEGGASFGLNGAGSVSWKYNTWTISGSRSVGEEEITIKDGGDEGSLKDFSVNLKGELDIGAYGLIRCDAVFAGTVGVGVEGKASAGLNITGSTDDLASDAKYTFFNEENRIHPYIKLEGTGYFYVSPLGITLKEITIPIKSHDFSDTNWYFDPTFPANTTVMNAEIVDGAIGPFFKAEYRMAKGGLYRTAFFEPCINVFEIDLKSAYEGTSDDKVFKTEPVLKLKPTQDSKTTLLTMNHAYKFSSLATNLDPSKAHVAVPCLYNPATEKYMYYPKYGTKIFFGDPQIDAYHIIQTQGRELTKKERDKLNKSDKKSYRFYEYAVVLFLANGGKMKALNFETTISDGYGNDGNERILFQKEIEDKRNFSSGYYIYKFSFIYNPKDPTKPLDLDCVPYFENRSGAVQPTHERGKLALNLFGNMTTKKSVGYNGFTVDIPIEVDDRK